MSFLLTLGIAVMGGLGAVARFACDTQLRRVYTAAFPLPTLLINALASFLAGLLAALALTGGVSHTWQLLLATGFLGGFSTFSTAVNDVVVFLRQERYGLAAGSLAASLLVPLFFAALGYLIV